MSLHHSDKNKEEDESYIEGSLELLMIGNECRYLDGRRTEGCIEEIFSERGCFRWRISKYEDAGEAWDIDLEDIVKFQFKKGSRKANKNQINAFKNIVEKVNVNTTLAMESEETQITMSEVNKSTKDIKQWMMQELDSADNMIIDLKSDFSNQRITKLLQLYMKKIECTELEEKTANQLVLNPNSGEWFKGLLITMAEMGLVNYYGKVVRDDQTFKGIGSKELRRKYIIHRLAFVRAMFEINDVKEVLLYRGMSSEGNWMNKSKSMLNMTFSRSVAEEFSDLNGSSIFKTSYIVKMTLPIELVFMTVLKLKN